MSDELDFYMNGFKDGKQEAEKKYQQEIKELKDNHAYVYGLLTALKKMGRWKKEELETIEDKALNSK